MFSSSRLVGNRGHPRGCGEQQLKMPCAFMRVGSSPRRPGAREASPVPAVSPGAPRWRGGGPMNSDSIAALRRTHSPRNQVTGIMSEW